MIVRKISGYKVKCMDVFGGGYPDTYFTDSDVKIDTLYGTVPVKIDTYQPKTLTVKIEGQNIMFSI